MNKKRTFIYILSLMIFIAIPGYAQGSNFTVKTHGIQTFHFTDPAGRNQIIFYSRMTLEDITGTASGVSGTITFDPQKISSTINGEISVQVKSMTTGIGRRDEHLMGEGWLNANAFPTITFKLKEMHDTKATSPNQVEAIVVGEFTLHGVTKTITTRSTLAYMEESEKTKSRAPGDLLQLRTKFTVKLSEFGVKGVTNIVGTKVNDQIDIEMNIVGSNGVK